MTHSQACESPQVELSIIIVTYNSENWIDRCLDAVGLASPPSVTTEIVVVDNGSSDRSRSRLIRRPESLELILLEENLGFAAAVNRGADRSSGDKILLLNPDTEVGCNSISRLVTFAEEHPGHGLYGGRAFLVNGDLTPGTAYGLPTLWSSVCFALGLDAIWPRSELFDPESLGSWKRDTVREVGLLTGCMLLVDRATWDTLGGFDERFFMYSEDADFSRRARDAGWRPVVVPEATLTHAVAASSPARADRLRLILAGRVTYYYKHLSNVDARIAVTLLLVGVALRAGAESLVGRRRRHAGPQTEALLWRAVWRDRSSWRAGYPVRGPSI